MRVPYHIMGKDLIIPNVVGNKILGLAHNTPIGGRIFRER